MFAEKADDSPVNLSTLIGWNPRYRHVERRGNNFHCGPKIVNRWPSGSVTLIGATMFSAIDSSVVEVLLQGCGIARLG